MRLRTKVTTYKDRFNRVYKVKKKIKKKDKLSVKDALTGEHSQAALEAIIGEINNMLHYQVGTYTRITDIPLDKRRHIIYSFMFLKDKYKPDGSFDKIKARMVGDGKHQNSKLYNMVSSSTVALSSVMLMLNIASKYNAKVASYDVGGAFLHAKLEEDDPDIYLKVTKDVANIWKDVDPSARDFLDDKGEITLKLDRFIYGLKQSSYKFQQHLVKCLTALGYRRLESDECLFIKRVGDQFSIISTHVDDILQVATTQQLVDELHNHLKAQYEDITYHPNADSYVGMTLTRSHDGSVFDISQTGLIDKVIDKFLTSEDRRQYKTPANDDIFEVDADDTNAPTVDRTEYLSLIMSLMYIGRLTRPDILLPVTYLATRSVRPTVDDMAKGKRIVSYLRRTRELTLRLHCEGPLQLHISCDASYAVHADGKGHTGYTIHIGDTQSFVHARSGKQKLNSTSSTDAEILALCEATKTTLHLRNILEELSLEPKYKIIAKQDNQSAILMSTNPSKFAKSKHLLTKLMFIRGLYANKILEIEYQHTSLIIADLLTKPKQGGAFCAHRANLLGIL